MDIAALIQPRIVDRDALNEFADALVDHAPQLERCVAQLRASPRDRDLIAALFRTLHTIKGDAAICRVELGVMIAHPIETLLSRMRAGELPFSELVAEAVLLALDRLELAVESLQAGRPLSQLRLPELVGGLETLGNAAPAGVDPAAAAVIEAVTGFRPSAAAQLKPSAVTAPLDRAADLAFFRSIALHLESRSTLFHGRTERLLRLVADTNAEAGQPVDAVQLEAAACLHDVGMMMLPESVWLKVGALSEDETRQMRVHPEIGAGILQRMPGWEPASRIVAQHHEMPDGGGYPHGLKGAQIEPGAQILAIADAFEAITLKHSHRGQSRSLLRAVAELNACDNQFSPELMRHFNQVIRRTLEA